MAPVSHTGVETGWPGHLGWPRPAPGAGPNRQISSDSAGASDSRRYRQISPTEDTTSRRQVSSDTKCSDSRRASREHQALLQTIERDYASELRRISRQWVLHRAPPPKKVTHESEEDATHLRTPYVDVAEALGIPEVMLGAMLAAKCRDLGIQVTKDRQQKFAEFVYANCSGQAFNLPESHLGAEFAKAVAFTLAFCARYTELNLSGNSLGDLGAQIMAHLLLKTMSLTTVDLSANDISSKGIGLILKAMLFNRSVRSLDLSSKTSSSRNRFSRFTAGPLEDLLEKNSSLQRLSLSACTLGVPGAQGLGRGLVANHSLLYLDISQNDLGDRGAFCMAAVLKECHLEELNLSDNRIGDEGFISLACSLGSLPNKADGSHPVWSRAMKSSEAAAKYTDGLNILRTTVAQAPAQELFEVPIGLTQKKTPVEQIQEAAQVLHMAVKAAEVALPKLKTLNLSNNQPTAIGTRAVADALHVNDVMERLQLDRCDHRDPDHGYEGLIGYLPVNTTLRHLGLSHAVLGAEGLTNLAKCMVVNQALRSLNLSGNLMDEAVAAAWGVAIGCNKSLRHLVLCACHITDASGLLLARGLAQNEGLESLSLRDNALRDAAAEALEEALLQNGSVVQLNLELNSMDLRFLMKIKQLLERNDQIREKSLPDRYRSRIVELTECQKEVTKMSNILARNRQKKKVALWKQAAEVQKLKDEKEADRQRQATVEDQLHELLKTQQAVEEEISVLESKLNLLRADGAHKVSVLGRSIEEVEEKMRIGEIQLQKMRKQLEIFEDQASVELAEVKGDLERAMKAQQSAALLSTAAQRNLSTFTESLKSISEDIAGGVNPRQRWTELQEAQAKRTPTAPKAKPKTVTKGLL